MIINSLYSYPIKSLGGNKIETAKVGKRGFKNDRRFMFIDSENNFVTARTHHQLGGINVQQINNNLVFKNHFNQNEIE